MMIESIEFRNFKALRNTTLPLGRFTLLVGPNGSGKSTALQAIPTVVEPARAPFDRIATAGTPRVGPGVAIRVKWDDREHRVLTHSHWQPKPSGPHHVVNGREFPPGS